VIRAFHGHQDCGGITCAPVGLLFVLAADQNELGDIDEQVVDQLMQSALASLETPDAMTAQMGDHYG
jgi:hypothetical protein